MLNKTYVLAVALMMALAGTAATAQIQTRGSDSDTTLFAGVNFTFGSGGQNVEGVVGLAYGEIDTSNDVKGAKASLHFGFMDGFSLNKVKLTALFGSDDAQAEIGGGYSLKSGAPFMVIGANGEYFSIGTDIFFDGQWDGYLGLHSIGKLSTQQNGNLEWESPTDDCPLEGPCT